ncbi:MAG: DUF4347 domain-containing protein [Leptolyngbyaceae cyanobacterium bins.349]|nr:DUF4347 domain-containing protein [Leptolyngbyaceae cyanobacterium bins.349]
MTVQFPGETMPTFASATASVDSVNAALIATPTHAQAIAAALIATPTHAQAIALLDARLQNLPTLVAALDPAIQPYILHPEQDVISQIDALLQSASVQSLYLFGHGAPGRMHLGQGQLDVATVQAQASVIANWQVKEVLLYGCEVGQSVDLLDALHRLTGASIAASTQVLGNTESASNWTLDVAIGARSLNPIFDSVALQAYQGTFPDLITGLGGAAGFGEGQVTEADDVFDQINVSAVFQNGFNFFGTTYNAATQFFIGTNGYVTFGQGLDSYSPQGIAGSVIPMIASHYTDIDPRVTPIGTSPGGTSTGTNNVYYDIDTVNDVVTITYDDVMPFVGMVPDLTQRPAQGNAHQIRLFDLGNGDFAIELRYENLFWGRSDAASAYGTAGWTAGNQVNFGEVTGSGTVAIENIEAQSNIGQPGVFRWEVRGGTIVVNPTVNLSVSTATGTEAGTTQITVTATASSAVSGNQTVALGVTGTGITTGDYTLSSNIITIPNGQTTGSVTFTVVNDLVAEGPETAVLTLSNPSAGITLGSTVSQNIAITDNDTAGVTITQSGGNTTVTEGGPTDTYTVVLTSQPTANVTVNITNVGGQTTTNPTTRTFTPQNWNTAQTVTVTAVNDTTAEGNHSGNITHSVTSTDTRYNGITVSAVSVSIIDNDIANTAPVLSDTVITLAPVLPGAGTPVGAVGTLVSQIADLTGGAGQNNIADSDVNAQVGVAITAANTTNGSWFYSIDNGANWLALGNVSNTNARLLAADANTRVYFRPNAGFTGAIADGITFRAWDRTTGTNGGSASTATNGGTSAFSSAFDTAAIRVQTPTIDFNKDGLADLLWVNRFSGTVSVSAMDGATTVAYTEIGTVAPSSGWELVGVGDLSKDGGADLVWRNFLTGQNAIWTMDGTAATGYTEIASVTPNVGWDVVGVGDLTKDGNADILWHNSQTGVVALWAMDGTTVTNYIELGAIPVESGWEPAALGDLNNDGNSDIIWRNELTGQNAIWTMDGVNVTSYAEIASVPAGAGWRVAGVTDYTKDGNADLLWHNDFSGQTLAWGMNGTAVTGLLDLPSGSPTSGWGLA